MTQSVRLLILVLLATFLISQPNARADPAPPSLRVATRVVAPLVQKTNGQLTGFSIDLWNAVAARLGAKTTFIEMGDVNSLLNSVRTGQADLGISAISITAERDKIFDFSQPMLSAGLQILVRGKSDQGAPNPLQGFMRLILSPMILVWLGIAAILIVVPAHIVWLLERRQSGGIIPDPRYFPGIFHALWWAAGTLATQADQMPRQWLARAVAILWMFTGVIFVAYYTAQLTAALTVAQIQGDINGPDDLPGKRVATTRGSTAAAFLKEQHARVEEDASIEQAYQALLNGTVDAVVFDAPVLLYFAEHDGKGRVQIAGTVFKKEDYGIVFAEGNPLRKRVDEALLELREDGTYERLYQKWFGAS
ncbi:MAG: transporter substrate-binding domain-containing protein [Hyphomicrobium sp.]|uniref:transporter substrate-binding domain-containing protein n=1 Tax=Hyphomicrobium sp. TaxID=82 RepID=UPI0039E625AD